MFKAVFLGLAKALGAFLIKLLTSFASEAFIKWLFFYIAGEVTKSTKTDHDDKFLAKAKETYEQYEGKK